jgi:uncharacterized protein involved in outer membrane biogenesis
MRGISGYVLMIIIILIIAVVIILVYIWLFNPQLFKNMLPKPIGTWLASI